jgi:septum formation protein
MMRPGSVTDAPFVWLASQSPRRAQLLAQIGVLHRPLLADEREDAEALEHERPGESPLHYVERVTRAKLAAAVARHAARSLPVAPILCADTTVAIGSRILAKPRDADDAVVMLTSLAGRTHHVITAVGVAAGERTRLATSVSTVRFAAMPRDAIEAYVASGEPSGKAGAYAIQGRIAAWIEHIEGSHSGIMGLPLHETAVLLRKAGHPV